MKAQILCFVSFTKVLVHVPIDRWKGINLHLDGWMGMAGRLDGA